MSAFPQIRAAIVETVETVPDIGCVHAFERYASDRTRLRALYVSSIGGRDQLRGWFIRRKEFSAARTGASRRTITTTWEIVGYMALADEAETELAFDGLVDAIADAFQANPSLNGTVVTTIFDDGAGLSQADSGPVMFAGVLCHAVSLQLKTRHVE